MNAGMPPTTMKLCICVGWAMDWFLSFLFCLSVHPNISDTTDPILTKLGEIMHLVTVFPAITLLHIQLSLHYKFASRTFYVHQNRFSAISHALKDSFSPEAFTRFDPSTPNMLHSLRRLEIHLYYIKYTLHKRGVTFVTDCP